MLDKRFCFVKEMFKLLSVNILGMWRFVGETIGECRNVTLMDQKLIADEANKNKQKWNVNKITSLHNGTSYHR
jgi:hypothetical protein